MHLPSRAAARLFRRIFGIASVVAISTIASDALAATATISLQQVDRANANGALGTIDLTQGGLALDWLKPTGSNLSLAEKDVASLLTFSTLGTTFTPATYLDDGYTFSWSGGDSASPSGPSKQGSNENSATVGRGFRLNFIAPSPGDFTVYYYSAANGPLGNYQLTAFEGANQLAFKNPATNIGSDSVDELIWTIQISADSAGQSFNMDLTRQAATSGAIAITGATVIPEPTSFLLLALGSAVALRRRRS